VTLLDDLVSSDCVYVTLILSVEEEVEELQVAGGTNAMVEKEGTFLDARHRADGVATGTWVMMPTMEEQN